MLVDEFGRFFRESRLALGLTLRAYCNKHGEDPAYISRLERGIIRPPKDVDVLNRLAKSLGFGEGSDEWKEFNRMAAISAGRIPGEVMADEELVKRLPVFFRTIAGEKFPDDDLEDLIEFLREYHSEKGDD